MPSLPLFPLGSALMPGAELGLQIFEPRYVQLLRDLIEGQDSAEPVFGVVAIRRGFEVGTDAAGDLYEVGCAARITQAFAVAGQALFMVQAVGTQRFHLDALHTDERRPYPSGDITWWGEPTHDPHDGDGDVAVMLAASLRAELLTYLQAVDREEGGAKGQPDFAAPNDATELSYWVAQALSLGLGPSQRLLACPDTSARLRLGRKLVRQELALARTLGAIGTSERPPMNLN